MIVSGGRLRRSASSVERQGGVAVGQKKAKNRIDQGGVLGDKTGLLGAVRDQDMLYAIHVLHFSGFRVDPIDHFLDIASE